MTPILIQLAITSSRPSVSTGRSSYSTSSRSSLRSSTTTRPTMPSGVPSRTSTSTYGGRTYSGTNTYYNTNNLIVWYIIWSTVMRDGKEEKVQHCYDKDHKEISCAKQEESDAGGLIVVFGVISIVLVIIFIAVVSM